MIQAIHSSEFHSLGFIAARFEVIGALVGLEDVHDQIPKSLIAPRLAEHGLEPGKNLLDPIARLQHTICRRQSHI